MYESITVKCTIFPFWFVSISQLCSLSLLLQDLRKAGLLVFANKQDVKGCMSVAEISQSLQLTSVKDHQWHIQACCALTGEGWEELSILIPFSSSDMIHNLKHVGRNDTLNFHSHVSRLCQGLEWMMSRLRVRWWPLTLIETAPRLFSFPLPPSVNLNGRWEMWSFVGWPALLLFLLSCDAVTWAALCQEVILLSSVIIYFCKPCSELETTEKKGAVQRTLLETGLI